MSNNFKNNFKSNINITNDNKPVVEDTIIPTDSADSMFVLKKKIDDKKGKKVFNVYMESDKLKELDKACKKSGYSRNELVNVMVEYCINNLKLEE
ncbi:CopG family transcriptional regulator [Clostridium tagluense]|uniref:CopG family transcriptional regulator n=1 Tax=Clostridium tagluense TaxID=360422 RepID=UPI001CF3A059|nr:CopG family transcriptional regulator [Clostridium tagluense]MCB2313772.1 CopG family transcriptional regulator [Clostridium tagluense]MCB2318589.1 CopG family transcriptional regulator [Clostridium tagluense]MCB2323435.1 CopG family transcriptional regulator [Clostridium tagluense]MCB2328272.1 CopG family transcriptional regulator [Clostridium tagluense]MCB2333071.1 CopG family transcriptional regulator [Clostridium tagluense]